MRLDWRSPDQLGEVQEGEVILISHNRGTWFHSDMERITCVVVYREGDEFQVFGPDSFDVDEITAWARFDAPANVITGEI